MFFEAICFYLGVLGAEEEEHVSFTAKAVWSRSSRLPYRKPN